MKVHKLHVPDNLVEKLNRVMQYRQPPQPPINVQRALYDTSDGGIFNWPPQKQVTIVVDPLPLSKNTSYGIYVRKRRQILAYTYYMNDGEWRSHVFKFPLD